MFNNLLNALIYWMHYLLDRNTVFISFTALSMCQFHILM